MFAGKIGSIGLLERFVLERRTEAVRVDCEPYNSRVVDTGAWSWQRCRALMRWCLLVAPSALEGANEGSVFAGVEAPGEGSSCAALIAPLALARTRVFGADV